MPESEIDHERTDHLSPTEQQLQLELEELTNTPLYSYSVFCRHLAPSQYQACPHLRKIVRKSSQSSEEKNVKNL